MKMIGIMLASVFALVGALSVPFFNQNIDEVPILTQPAEPVTQTNYYQMSRIGYDNLKDLKKDAQHVVIVNFVEKKEAIPDGGGVARYRTENVFHVEQVLKGDPAILDTDILVNEQGGIVGDTIYVMEENELFEPGQYLLFLEKVTDRALTPYDIYVVQGVIAGKFKLEGDKVRGYGPDGSRLEAEAYSKQELIETIKQL